MIKFAGIRSDEMNLIVEHYPQRQFPERSYEVLEVPGRDGDIVIDNGNFKNYRQSYSVFIDANSPDEETYQLVCRNIAAWLLGNPGYQRLEDSYDPEFYRMAYYSGGSNFSNFFNVYGRGSLEFTCAPRRFYKIGEKEYSISDFGSLRSPSSFLADPIYKITPEANKTALSLIVNNMAMHFTIPEAGRNVILDVEKHTCKLEDGRKASITSGEYDYLKLAKNNTIHFFNISELKIIPRWWTI